LIAAAGNDRPVLCVIDAQSLDRPSADALVFTARRLDAGPAAMLFGAREAKRTGSMLPGCPSSGWEASMNDL
jgi:hypothetical protein